MKPLFKNDEISKRLEKAIEVKQTLIKLDINEELCPGLKSFSIILGNWVRDGKFQEGKITLPEVGKKLVYQLSNPKYTFVKLSVL